MNTYTTHMTEEHNITISHGSESCDYLDVDIHSDHVTIRTRRFVSAASEHVDGPAVQLPRTVVLELAKRLAAVLCAD